MLRITNAPHLKSLRHVLPTPRVPLVTAADLKLSPEHVFSRVISEHVIVFAEGLTRP